MVRLNRRLLIRKSVLRADEYGSTAQSTVVRKSKMNVKLPRVILPREAGSDEWVLLRNPLRIVTAWKQEEVLPCIEAIEQAGEDGLYAAGFISYEASSGFDSALKTDSLENLPLVWFGIFAEAEPYELDLHHKSTEYSKCNWLPNVSRAEYDESINRVHSYLRAGDTYQVNYTFRMNADFLGDPWALFVDMQRAQRGAYAAYIETEEFAICSASPELFFSLDGDCLISRPMKGTAKRGLTVADDDLAATELSCSAKNQSENVMIVDMIRNDMGRIAEPGTVHVSDLFEVERFPTVLQMVSTVESRSSVSISEIMQALFPCASITGAPKVRTMQIINELEKKPRGIYTGSIGYLAPDRKAWFNVAIRTVMIDKDSAKAEYGIGGGIVWDSTAENEYQESLTKAAILTSDRPDFELLETLLWDSEAGFFLLDHHLARLNDSARYFGIKFCLDDCRQQLETFGNGLGNKVSRVRLLITEDGRITISASDYDNSANAQPWRIVLALNPVDTNNIFLYHKTTNRHIYEQAKELVPGFDDVLLWNDKYEVTESTIANIVIEKNGRKVTPYIKCGLLAGVFRGVLVDCGEIEEDMVAIDDVKSADHIWLINSVRKWVPATLVVT